MILYVIKMKSISHFLSIFLFTHFFKFQNLLKKERKSNALLSATSSLKPKKVSMKKTRRQSSRSSRGSKSSRSLRSLRSLRSSRKPKRRLRRGRKPRGKSLTSLQMTKIRNLIAQVDNIFK